jgi:hypothetical protein
MTRPGLSQLWRVLVALVITAGALGDAALDVAQQWLDAEVDATRAGDRGSA